jgi:hypothetical protein
MLKVDPHPDYPPEEGRYLRGNDRSPVEFEGQVVYDIGAYPEPPISGKITGRVVEPWKQPQSEQEQQAVRRLWDWVERVRKKQQEDKD